MLGVPTMDTMAVPSIRVRFTCFSEYSISCYLGCFLRLPFPKLDCQVATVMYGCKKIYREKGIHTVQLKSVAPFVCYAKKVTPVFFKTATV